VISSQILTLYICSFSSVIDFIFEDSTLFYSFIAILLDFYEGVQMYSLINDNQSTMFKRSPHCFSLSCSVHLTLIS
jgi:hypothetical protein